MELVVVKEFCFSTPRMDIQRCIASVMTATPAGFRIAQCLEEILKPAGVAVITEAMHLCMSMRGVEKQNSFTTTSSMLGCFKDDARTRSEFLSLITPTKLYR
jgi:GTP cyclohydrolase I